MASLAGLMRFAAIRRPASSRKGPPQVVWRSFATLSIKELRDLGVDTAQRGRTAGPHASEVLHFLRHAGLTQQELTRAVRRQPELLDANPAALEASAATLQGMLGSSTLTTLRDCPEVLLGALLEHQRLFDEWGLDVEVLTRSPRILLRVPRELRCVLEFLRDDASGPGMSCEQIRQVTRRSPMLLLATRKPSEQLAPLVAFLRHQVGIDPAAERCLAFYAWPDAVEMLQRAAGKTQS
ncbi:unnamed protein product [Durusdinium trenchii]|uniref:Uncharacterized protein n=1 Tax=Durusdinium trenchii TaxID=1381693 RepID=A0ABP0S1L2_9DINO